VLPFTVLFGVGLSLVVAPLTSTLMSSVPVRNAGVASAINNSISRIGQPILAALIFVVVTGSFYSALAGAVPGSDADDPALHAMVQPLNPPQPGAPPEIVDEAREASTAALHLAALVCAALMAAGRRELDRAPGPDGVGRRPQVIDAPVGQAGADADAG
jgi:hypothetical protein